MIATFANTGCILSPSTLEHTPIPHSIYRLPMRGPVVLVLVIAAIAAALGFAVKSPPTKPPEPPRPRVKLAVLVVFDQMRGDYFERWKPLFGKDGFARLQSDGAWFTNCHYPYATTTTGPGHASMLSGTCGDRHGIINNNWYEGGGTVYCAGSTRWEFVPGPTPKGKDVGNPERMRAETVADVLKRMSGGSKVFGLSLKDRSAILPTGKRPDGAYWFNGQFVTSTYYAERPKTWVTEFNKSRVADRWFGTDWTRFRTDIDYEKWSGPDKVAGEGKGISVTGKDDPAKGWTQGVTFPHPNTGGRAKPGKEYYQALANSPFGNELLLEFAKKCVIAEQLGADDAPDLLVVSFSSNDIVGHTWGPDSQEVLDVTLRSDALMADLLHFLDDHVGRDQYLLAVTADHGVCPLPEVSRTRGIPGKRVDPKAIEKSIEAHLTQTFGTAAGGLSKGGKKPAWIEAVVVPWVYFNSRVCASAHRSRADVAKAAAEFLATHPDIARAFTRADLEGTIPPEDEVATRVKRSYFPARSGDLYLLLKPYDLPSTTLSTGTTHGTPYPYDTHVPLLVYGPGIDGGARAERVTPQAAAAIFAQWLDIPPPNKADFPLPQALVK